MVFWNNSTSTEYNSSERGFVLVSVLARANIDEHAQRRENESTISIHGGSEYSCNGYSSRPASSTGVF